MSDDKNINESSQEVSDQTQVAVSKVMNTSKSILNSKLSKKSKDVMKKALKAGLKFSIKYLLWIVIVMLILLGVIMLVIVAEYGWRPSSKIYSISHTESNIEEEDNVYQYSNGKSTSSGARSRTRSASSKASILNISGNRYINLSEDNKAIENYHYYYSNQSVKENKYYIPLKGIDMESSSDEILSQLLDDGAIVLEGDGNFIDADSLTDFANKWLEDNGAESFTWSENIKKIDKDINKGATISGFKNKYIGNLTKVSIDDSAKIVDEYKREDYFKVPEELLSVLNSNVYDGELIYDKSFVQPVKFKYIIPKEFSEAEGDGTEKYENISKIKYKIDASGIASTKSNKYGIGSTFIYKPTIKVKVKKGVTVNQTMEEVKEKVGEVVSIVNAPTDNKTQYTVTGKNENGVKTEDIITITAQDDGTYKKTVTSYIIYHKPTAIGTPIHEVTADVVYILDRVITFSGVYSFEYELKEEEETSENTTTNGSVTSTDRDGNIINEMTRTQYKVMSYQEQPTNIKCENGVNNDYFYSYMGNVRSEIPYHLAKSFDIVKMQQAFKGEKTDLTAQTEANTGTSDMQEGVPNVLRWKPLCEEIGEKYGLDPALLLTIVEIESTGNPHTGNSNYGGLVAMNLHGTGDVKNYFKNDPDYSGYVHTSKNIYPNGGACRNSKSCDVFDAEHMRAVRYNLEYVARRLSAQMGFHLIKNKGIDYRKDEISTENMQHALYFTICGYQTGEYGQLKIFGNYITNKKNVNLYEPNGITYKNTFIYHLTTPMPGAGFGSSYRTAGASNATYLKKAYDFYHKYSDGIPLEQGGYLRYDLYDPSKWWHHIGFPGGGSSTPVESDTASIGSPNGMNSMKVNEYLEYEEKGINKNDSSKSEIIKHYTTNESKLMLNSALAMINEVETYSVKGDEADGFWQKGYSEKYFNEGLPSRGAPGRDLSQLYDGKIEEHSYDGNYNRLRELAKSYGNEVYRVVNRTIGQIGKDYAPSGIGPYDFDSAGLVWFVFNYNTSKPYFKADTVENYLSSFNNDIESGDLRPGDIVFISEGESNKGKATECLIYMGNDAVVRVEESGVNLTCYSKLIEDSNINHIGNKRIFNYSRGNNSMSMDGVNMYPGVILGDWFDPLAGYNWSVSSPPGYRTHPVTGQKNRWHGGADIPAPRGTPIYSTLDGEVIAVNSRDSSYGNHVVIRHPGGFTTLYAHMHTTPMVKVLDIVKKGQQIGVVGSTGRSTGNHLHWEVIYGKENHRGAKVGLYPTGDYIDGAAIIKGKPTNYPTGSTIENSSSPASKKRSAIASLAKQQVGKAYVSGAEGPNSFDCSGLVIWVYENAIGMKGIPRVSKDQAKHGKEVANFPDGMLPGDVVYLGYGYVSHIAIYVGNGEIVHASTPEVGVITTKISSNYFKKKAMGARRYIE